MIAGNRVKEILNERREAFIQDLELWTNIDSDTGNLAGSRKIAALLAQRVAELGGQIEERANERGVHVIARFPGEGTLKALLVVHTDTVLNTEEGRYSFQLGADGLAYGPGAGDCKASALQMLYVVEAFQALKEKPYGELIVYFDAEEETGSPDEFAFAQELAQQVDVAIIADTGRPNWGIVTKRKGNARYTLQVKGIGGHAGNSPQAAGNAVMELGHLLQGLYELASPLPQDPENYSTAALKERKVADHGQFIPPNSINAAVVGTPNEKVNVIPDEAWLKVEVRCYEQSELERLDQAIRELAAKPLVAGTTVTVEGGLCEAAYGKTAAVEEMVQLYKTIVKREFDADVVEWIAGGMTIGNVTASFTPTIDALGIDCDPLLEHTRKEEVDLKAFVPRTTALVLLLAELSTKHA